MPYKWEYMDDGWTRPQFMPAHEFATIDSLVEMLGERKVYISTVHVQHVFPEANDFTRVGGAAIMEMVEVSLCPDSPGAMEQLDREIAFIEKGSLN